MFVQLEMEVVLPEEEQDLEDTVPILENELHIFKIFQKNVYKGILITDFPQTTPPINWPLLETSL